MMRYRQIWFVFLGLWSIQSAWAQWSVKDSIVWLMDSTKKASYEAQYQYQQRALVLAKTAHFLDKEAAALIHLGRLLSYMGEHSEALDYFTQAELLIAEHDLSAVKTLFYLKKVGVLMRLDNYEEMIAHSQEAADWFTQQEDTINLGLVYGNIGGAYYKQRQMDIAEQFYCQALDILAPTTEKNNSMILTNLAGVYLETDPEKAIPIYLTYLEEVRKNNKKIHESAVLMNLGLAYALVENYPKAFESFEEALSLAKEEHLLNDQYNIFRLQSWVYEEMGNDEQALEYYKNYKELQEEVIGKQTQEKIAELKVKYETVAKEKTLALQKEKIRNLQQDAKIKRQRYVLLIAVVLGIGSLLSLLFYKRITDLKKNKALYLTQKELLQSDLKNKELERKRLKEKLEYTHKDVTSLTLDIKRKNEFADQLLTKIGALADELPKKNRTVQQQFNTLQLFVTDNLRINKELAVFQKNITEVNQDFYHKLLTKFPDLSAKDTELCGLIKLNQSNKEIAALKSISVSSAKMSRYRLRKKLGLKPTEDIVNFLRAVS